MKQKRTVNQKAVRIFAVLLSAAGLFLTATLAACNSDNDEIPGNDEIPENVSLMEFFETNFPNEQEGSGTDVKDVPFSGFDNQENVCVVINSYDELKTIYQGKNPLPEVVFSKYSLVIGRICLNVGKKFQKLTAEQTNNQTLITLYFAELNDAALTAATYYYYWALIPKFSPQTIVTKIDGSICMSPVADGNEKVVSFFEVELPATNRSSGFFTSEDRYKDVCYIINDDSDLRRRYTGNRELPSIDFTRYTLVMGKVIMPVSYYYVLKQDISVFGNFAYVNLFASLMSKDGYWTVSSTLYFWGLYPKFSAENITIYTIEDGNTIENIDQKKI